MHAFNKGTWSIFHNSDFSGEVIFINETTKEQLEVPFSIIKDIVAKYKKSNIITNLEAATTEEILNWSYDS